MTCISSSRLNVSSCSKTQDAALQPQKPGFSSPCPCLPHSAPLYVANRVLKIAQTVDLMGNKICEGLNSGPQNPVLSQSGRLPEMPAPEVIDYEEAAAVDIRARR